MNKRGETLLEVLIALTLVVVSAAAAASAITSATKGLSLSKNYLIAQNLASEGIEIVKNIRDTNWMKFPVNEECWMNLNDGADIILSRDCGDTPQTEITYAEGSSATNDYYFLKPANTDKWTLAHGGSDQIKELAIKYGLKLVQDVTTQEVYSYEPIDGEEPPVFYRGIRVLDQVEDEKILIEVIVKWYEGAKLFEIKGREVLTNYL